MMLAACPISAQAATLKTENEIKAIPHKPLKIRKKNGII